MRGRALHIGLSFGALALLSPPLASAQQPSWERFLSPHGYVVVSFPSEPGYKRRISDTIVGDVETDVWAASTAMGDFSLTYSHLPTLARMFSSRSMLYRKASERMLQEVSATLIDARPIEHPFWEFELIYQVGSDPNEPTRIGRARFRYIDGMVVTVNALVPVSRQGPARKYLGSVEMHPQT